MSTHISRRGFAKILGTSAAYAALNPSLSLSAPALRLVSKVSNAAALVRLSSNENPYGPSPLAVKAMTKAFSLAWRYPDEHEGSLVDALAKLHNVPAGQILLGNGSGEILKVAAAAFTAVGKKLVVANPTFEAILAHARTAQADVVKIDLTSDYAHDLPKMWPQPATPAWSTSAIPTIQLQASHRKIRYERFSRRCRAIQLCLSTRRITTTSSQTITRALFRW